MTTYENTDLCLSTLGHPWICSAHAALAISLDPHAPCNGLVSNSIIKRPGDTNVCRPRTDGRIVRQANDYTRREQQKLSRDRSRASESTFDISWFAEHSRTWYGRHVGQSRHVEHAWGFGDFVTILFFIVIIIVVISPSPTPETPAPKNISVLA